MEKKGLSTVVVSLILIVVALAAVAVIWVIINNVIGGQTGQVSLQRDCLESQVTPTRLICTGVVCDITVERGSGGKDIAGIKAVFTNATSDTNFVQDISGNIPVLGKVTTTGTSTGIENVNKVEITVYFTDSSGVEQLCPTPSSYSR